MKAIDLSLETNDRLDTWIKNYERKEQTDAAFYGELVAEKTRRRNKKLNLGQSIRHLIGKAQARQFTTYGDLAAASGVEWSEARRAMEGPHGHLQQLLEFCHANAMPLLTAICVNKEGLKSGDLTESALAGFVDGARRLGYPVADAAGFLGECQKKCFEWARANEGTVVMVDFDPKVLSWYRDQLTKFEQDADRETDGERREKLLAVADSYRKLIDHIEARPKKD